MPQINGLGTSEAAKYKNPPTINNAPPDDHPDHTTKNPPRRGGDRRDQESHAVEQNTHTT
jgi:hypothetical protein